MNVHEKSMGSYSLFAWREALAIAELFTRTNPDIRIAKAVYDELEVKDIIEFEQKNSQLIGAFIQKPVSQRPAFLTKTLKRMDGHDRMIFLVLSIIGVLRARQVMELRDRFRVFLVPGHGNRETTASIYDFSAEMIASLSWAWPSEVFEAIGVDDGAEE